MCKLSVALHSILKNLPLYVHNYTLALWDKSKENLILILDVEVDGKQSQAAVEIDYKLSRGQRTNSVQSLSVVDVTSCQNRNYELIEGSWK